MRVCERGQGEGGLELQLMWGVRMSQFTAGIDFDKPHQVTGPKGRIKANAYQPLTGTRRQAERGTAARACQWVGG